MDEREISSNEAAVGPECEGVRAQRQMSQLSIHSSRGAASGSVSDSSDFDLDYDDQTELPFISKIRAMKICKEFVTVGAWKKITLDKFTLASVKGGLSNLLYLCSLMDDIDEGNGPAGSHRSSSPTRLLLRVHCQIHDSKMEENIIFTVLSERKLGPRLYGVFNGGRVEEYIPSSALTPQDLCVSNVSHAIAEMLARVHSLHVPISKKPRWIRDVLDRWISHARRMRGSALRNKLDPELLSFLLQLPYEAEAKFIKNVISRVKEPVVFCHNDLQEGNILNKSESTVEPDLLFIDYEYCSYNYRSFDIANHLSEWAIDYKVDAYPHFTMDMSKYPSIEQQRRFVTSYVRAVRRERQQQQQRVAVPCGVNGSDPAGGGGDGSGDGSTPPDGEAAQVDTILAQLPVFSMASNLVWCLWSVVQADMSPVTFGFLEHAVARWENYTQAKEKFTSEEAAMNQS